MSFYLVTDTRRPEVAEARALSRLVERHGYSPLPAIRFGHRALHLFDNPDHSVLCRLEGDRAGRDLISVGPFLYRGRHGRAALAALADDLDGGGIVWEETAGHFSLLVRENDRLTIWTDGLGSHKIYHDRDFALVSNSFLALLASRDGWSFDPVGIYAYLWGGANYGTSTFVHDLKSLPADVGLELQEATRTLNRASLCIPSATIDDGDLKLMVAHCLPALRDTVERVVDYAAGQVRLSFSGGYDSRLLLALLQEQGVRPELFVYGREGDIDVEIAQKVAAAEGLKLTRIEKDLLASPSPDSYPSVVEEALVRFDGWKSSGIFDSGADGIDRPRRHRDGFVPVNGGLGEIYRNFFNVFDRGYPATAVVDAFYRNFLPGWATEAFDETVYRSAMAEHMAAQVGDGSRQARRLSSRDVQLLYPLFRGRFWTAREAEINQRFGAMFFPYLEHRCIRTAAEVPLRHRNFGRLQAAMIREVSPRLASLPTGYGFSFDSRPSLGYRLDAWASLARPTWLRPRLSRLKLKRRRVNSPYLTDTWLGTVLDTDFPVVRQYVRPERVNDQDCFNRVATLEYLAERFSIRSLRPD